MRNKKLLKKWRIKIERLIRGIIEKGGWQFALLICVHVVILLSAKRTANK